MRVRVRVRVRGSASRQVLEEPRQLEGAGHRTSTPSGSLSTRSTSRATAPPPPPNQHACVRAYLPEEQSQGPRAPRPGAPCRGVGGCGGGADAARGCGQQELGGDRAALGARAGLELEQRDVAAAVYAWRRVNAHVRETRHRGLLCVGFSSDKSTKAITCLKGMRHACVCVYLAGGCPGGRSPGWPRGPLISGS